MNHAETVRVAGWGVTNTMTNSRSVRVALVGFLSLAMTCWCTFGCRTTSSSAGPDVGSDSPTSAVSYDPSRAFLTLDQIKPVPDAPAPPAEPIQDLSSRSARRLARARDLYRRQRFTESGLEIEKALRHEPKHPLLHRELALSLYATGNAERVRSHLRKALAVQSDDVVTHYLAGRLALDQRRYDDAIKSFRIAMMASNSQTLPSYATLCHFYLAKALNAAGYLTAAIAEYRQYESGVAALSDKGPECIDLETLVEINHGRAGGPISVAYEKLGQYGEAADALADSVRDRKPDAGTREHLARLLARTGRYEEALEQARLLFDQSDRAIDLMVDIHESAGHPEGVIDEIERLYRDHPDRVDLLLSYADALGRFGRHADAKRVLLAGVKQHPSETAIIWRLADMLRDEGEWSQAIDIVADALGGDPLVYDTARQKVVAWSADGQAVATLLGPVAGGSIDPGDYARAYLLGTLAAHAGRRDQAKRLFESAVSLRPDFTPARIELADIHLARYEWQAAIDLVTADNDALQNDGRLQRLCGEAYAGLDELDQAETHLRAALRLNRGDVDAMVALAAVYRLGDEPRRYRRQLESVLAANPLHEATREKLLEVYLRTPDRLDAARNQLSELQRLSASPSRIARCAALVERGPPTETTDWAGYEKQLTDAIEQFGADARTLVRIASARLRLSRAEDALKALKQAMAVDPANIEAIELSVGAYEQLLDYGSAIDSLHTLLARHPNRRRWINRLGFLQMVDHQFDDAYALAVKELSRPRLSDEDRRKARGRASEALRRAKRHDERIALLQRWRKEDENDVTLAQSLIEALVSADRYDDAITEAARWYDRDPQASDARQAYWWALMRAKRFDQAEQVVLAALEVDPGSSALQQQLILLLSVANRFDDALELVDTYSVSPRERNTLVNLRLTVLESAKRYADAIELLSDWLLEEESASGRIDMGLIHQIRSRIAVTLILSHQYEEAAKKLNKWIDEAENDRVRFIYLRTLSQCYQGADDRAESIDALQRAHDLLRQDVGINNDLGYSLADAGIRVDEAEEMIRFALARSPQNGAYLDSMGWVLYKQGRFDEALSWLEKAVDTDTGDDPVVYDHLGDVRWRLGKEDALGAWRKALKVFVDDPTRLEPPSMRELQKNIEQKVEAVEKNMKPPVAPLAKPASATERSPATKKPT